MPAMSLKRVKYLLGVTAVLGVALSLPSSAGASYGDDGPAPDLGPTGPCAETNHPNGFHYVDCGACAEMWHGTTLVASGCGGSKPADPYL